jgi:tripartite ATP-independent transporter DctM subunit
MDPQTVGWISIVLLFVLLAIRVPIYLMMGVLGIAGFWVLSGSTTALKVAGLVPYTATASHDFSVMPLFVLMGHLIFHTGFTSEIYRSAMLWLGRIPGGVAQATVLAGAAFGAASASSFAAVATLGKTTIPEMTRMGVDRKIAFGVVAISANLAQMIPPSVFMVIYGIIAEQSIGKLLVAGIIPGIIATAVYMVIIYIMVKRNPKLAPVLEDQPCWKERLLSLKSSWGIIVIFVLVMGGIYAGVFTPTEAGGIGAFGTFVIALALRKINYDIMKSTLFDTAKTTGMILLIVATAFIFSRFLSISRLPVLLSDLLVNLDVPPMVILIGVMFMYIVLGCFLDVLAIMFITLPIILPALEALGYDLIWIGVLMVHLIGIASITPPFGLNLFILKATLPDSDMKEIFGGTFPFFIASVIVLVIYTAFPQLSLWLPSLM